MQFLRYRKTDCFTVFASTIKGSMMEAICFWVCRLAFRRIQIIAAILPICENCTLQFFPQKQFGTLMEVGE